MNVIDVRRRGNETAHVFFIKKSLKKYTKRTVNCFSYDSRKARRLLKQLLRKFRENKMKNMNKSPLFSPFYVQDGRYEAKNKTLLTLSNEGEAQSRLFQISPID